VDISNFLFPNYLQSGCAAEIRWLCRICALYRVFDNYVLNPQQKCVVDTFRTPEARDRQGVADAKATLETVYAWPDGRMTDREWAVGTTFTPAGCAAGSALFYADWTHRIPERFTSLIAYRRRLLTRPSFARAIDEVRP